ncbi:pleckstrin homology domain-containing family G member 5-like isoform X3 [Varroa destructor]|uniref:DH domain-containing protein n=1 Tax=Varroa destructor TaxID=109461 RepID=A0A7M7KI25_VARDE|nr:pleckstrin homology domain-containing family G member 5-like isoform X3 [Varroa destructor]XP_022667241.1 pleckstrin homology domain-containing family G member 5-like isoform X3 [Varroa destructor]XP_022667242.1 pleckstrin homology domain-containing family G member 5-like isoform X3 [Varroa destructor]
MRHKQPSLQLHETEGRLQLQFSINMLNRASFLLFEIRPSSGANSTSLSRISDEDEEWRGAHKPGPSGVLSPRASQATQGVQATDGGGGQAEGCSLAAAPLSDPVTPRAERKCGLLARSSTAGFAGDGPPTSKGSSFGRAALDRQWRKLFHSNSQDHHDEGQRPSREKHSLKFRRQDILNSELYAHRSKSLTQIDCLGSRGRGDMLSAGVEEGQQSTPCPDRLAVPPEGGGPSGDSSGRSTLLSGTHKVPSQEYLSVTVECEDSRPQEMEIVPVAKGAVLRDVLSGVLERRGLNISSVSVVQEGSSKKPNLTTDTHKLAGCHFRIKVKEGHESQSVARANSTSSLSSTGNQWRGGSGPGVRGVGSSNVSQNSSSSLRDKDQRKMTSSALTGSQRGRRGGLSTEDLSSELQQIADSQNSWKNSKGRQAIGRKAGLLATGYRMDKASQDKEDMRLLTELLNQYAQSGIPAMALGYSSGSDDDESLFYIEDSWRQIVESPEVLDKQLQSQQEALWELLATEASYIRTLKVVVELFLSTLCNLQDKGLLNDIDVDKMFSNIVDIYEVNRTFWTKCLQPLLREGRIHRRPLNPLRLRDGFIHFEELFEPYIKYCLEQATCLAYVKENRHESVLFKSYVAWCESQKECGRLRFTDLLVKPMQRLTKYSLLLKAILKKTDQLETRAGLAEMNDMVERFVCNVDAQLRQRHEHERLESLIGRIEAYEPFDTTSDEVEKALRDNFTLDLTCAMPGCGQQNRQLVAEVPGVKFRDAASSSKIDVHCLFLTDMLLLCKSIGRKGQDKLKVIRQPFVVERLIVRDMKDASLLLVYQNEYRVVAWYLQLFGPEQVLRGLVEQLRKAQDQFARARAAAVQGRHAGLAYLATSYPEDPEDDAPRPSLLTAGRSPRSSSHSSLVHSHSGSIDMSDPVSASSQAPTVPCPTPLFGASSSGSPQGGRATSFELGELQRQDSSCQLDHLDLLQQHRSRSVETRGTSSVSVTVTSPRPERRAFLLKGCSPVGPSAAPSNTLTVSVPLQQHQYDKQDSLGSQFSPTIQVPLASPTKTLCPHSPPSPRTLQRALLHNSSPTKPPLLKTKNVSGLVTHSAPVSEGPSPIHSLDSSESTSISLSLQQQRPQLQQPSSHSGSDEGGTGEVNTTTNQNSGQVSLQQTGQQPQAAHSGTTPTQSSAAESPRAATPRISSISVGVIPAMSPVEPPTPVQETPNPILPLPLVAYASPPPGQQSGSSSTPSTGANSDSSVSIPVSTSTTENRRKDDPTQLVRPHRELPPPPPRRTPRTDGSGRLHPRRHHTADSFEHLKQSRDASIHKRLSWNCGQQLSETAAGCPSSIRSGASVHGHGVSPHQQAIMAADLRSRNQCLSSESMYSSSGVSSTGSLLLSGEDGSGGLIGGPLGPTGGLIALESYLGQHPFPQQTIVINGIDPFEDDPIQEEDEGSAAEETPQPVPVIRAKPQYQLEYIAGQPGSRIKIDISEVAETVASDDAPAVHFVTAGSICCSPDTEALREGPSSPSLPERRANDELVTPRNLPTASPQQTQRKEQQEHQQQLLSIQVTGVPSSQHVYSQKLPSSQVEVCCQPSPASKLSEMPLSRTEREPEVVAGNWGNSTNAPQSPSQQGDTPPMTANRANGPQSKRQPKDLHRMKELLLDNCSFDVQDV